MLKDKDYFVRSETLSALNKIDSNWRSSKIVNQAVPEFITALKDKDSSVRKRAAAGLGEMKDLRAVGPLIAALNDEDDSIRRLVVKVLKDLKDPRAVGPLITSLKDNDAYVRGGAAWILGELGDSRAVTPLISVLKDEYYFVRKAALEALQMIAGQNFGENITKWQEWWEKNKRE